MISFSEILLLEINCFMVSIESSAGDRVRVHRMWTNSELSYCKGHLEEAVLKRYFKLNDYSTKPWMWNVREPASLMVVAKLRPITCLPKIQNGQWFEMELIEWAKRWEDHAKNDDDEIEQKKINKNEYNHYNPESIYLLLTYLTLTVNHSVFLS